MMIVAVIGRKAASKAPLTSTLSVEGESLKQKPAKHWVATDDKALLIVCILFLKERVKVREKGAELLGVNATFSTASRTRLLSPEESRILRKNITIRKVH